MVEVYKILNGLDESDEDQLFTVQPIQEPEVTVKNCIKQFRIELRKHFFSQRVIDEWNSLTEEVISSDSLNQFKSRLNKFWKDIPTNFESDCYSYPLAHARHHQLYERRQEWAQESRDYTRPRILQEI